MTQKLEWIKRFGTVLRANAVLRMGLVIFVLFLAVIGDAQQATTLSTVQETISKTSARELHPNALKTTPIEEGQEGGVLAALTSTRVQKITDGGVRIKLTNRK